MAKSNDQKHFEKYREQTQVKHEILEAYLSAYFHIIRKSSNDLIYIDGFAGCGSYVNTESGESIDGSPIRVLRLIAENQKFASHISTIFIEADHVLYKQLKEAVSAFYQGHQNIREPKCLRGTFSEHVNEILKRVPSLAPTFLFVDPCGVTGVDLVTIQGVMKNDKCEVFIFFNIDGVRRIAGFEKLSPVLVNLIGSKDRAHSLYNDLRETHDASRREGLILSCYIEALRDIVGAKYTVPFRVEHESKRRVSHYLIHASKHPLGFRIMKDVMWRHGRSEYQEGALEFAQASRTSYIPLFDQFSTIKESIIDELRKGQRKVSFFCKEWVSRPNDSLCETAYKVALLELEALGVIQVIGKDRKSPAPANARRKKRDGKPTLGDEYFVRLASG